MSSKFRNLKVKPRLNVSRSQVKIQETSEEDPKKEPEDIKHDEKEAEAVPEEPEKIFTPPPPVISVPRCESADASEKSDTSCNKFRKPKPAPRLNVSRSAQKITDSIIEQQNKNDEIQLPSPATPSEPDLVFSPPPVPISPMRPRSDTPRDFLQSPTYSINHNVHYPATSQSPFMPIPHSRIRTESLSSIKSIPANLQPRKKFRTEDQKILDNKRESRERLSNKNVEKSQLRMFDMIYYNPSTNPMKSRASKSEEKPEEKPKEVPESPAASASSAPVPQLRLNAKGELVLDESSLVVENEEHRRNRILLANTNLVVYDEMSTGYGFYKRQKRTREWPHEETVKFYRCLNTVGTDFSLMLNLFPNRTRRDLKLKFKKEEKNNSQLIDKALLKFNTFDIEELQRELEKEDEEKRKETENGSSEVKELVKRKILKKQEAKARQQQTKSKIEKILADGEEAMKLVNANKPTETESSPLEIKENFEEKKVAKKRAKPNVASVAKRRKPSAVVSENLEAADNLMVLEVVRSPTIKLETRDLKTECVDLVNQSIMDEAESEWGGSNVIDDLPQFSLIDTPLPLINAKIEYQVLEIEEPSQVQCASNFGAAQENVEKNPSTSADSEASFDEESFINSLNLEQLSIVVRQIDGKNIYDIHETNPDTLLISAQPLNIPQHMKDILISVMTQDE